MAKWAWVCLKCSTAATKAGDVTLDSVADAARDHGCFRVTRPATKREAKNLVRVQVPYLMRAEEWRTVWDSLDHVPSRKVPCKSPLGDCGHSDSLHEFFSLTQPYCVINCRGCA